MPLSLILVRGFVTDAAGLEVAGHWQAVWRVSEVYLTVYMSMMTLYFMPRISELTNAKDLASEVVRTTLIMTVMVAFTALVIYLSRDMVVDVLYTPMFRPMRDLFAYQLIGDILRMAVWCFGFVLVAKDYHKWYVLLEILTPAIFVLSTTYLMGLLGVKAVPISYALAYAINLVIVLFVLRALISPNRLSH